MRINEATNVEQLVYNWYIPRSLCLIFLLLLVSYGTKYINQMLELIRFQEKSLFKRGIKKVKVKVDLKVQLGRGVIGKVRHFWTAGIFAVIITWPISL